MAGSGASESDDGGRPGQAAPVEAELAALRARIEQIWAGRDDIDPADPEIAVALRGAIGALDTGAARVAEWNPDGSVTVNEWCKFAILLLFMTAELETIEHGPFEYADKIPLKRDFARRGVRVVPGAQARWGSYQAPGVVMMPSYTNIGAYVGENTMVDTWATVGSCAQIGANVHLSGGVGVGGVLEPAQAAPVMIGDECYIGSRAIVAEGARVGEGTVLGAGAILTGSIPVIDVETGQEISRGEVPPWCVAVAGTRPRTFPGGDFGLPCILVLKRLAAGERHDKSALNEILRDHGQAL